jgi:sugar phosphate isomerase/epimerase
LLEYEAPGDNVPRITVQKGRVRPDDTTLIESMQAVIERLDRLEQEALELAVRLDLEWDQALGPGRHVGAGPEVHRA